MNKIINTVTCEEGPSYYIETKTVNNKDDQDSCPLELAFCDLLHTIYNKNEGSNDALAHGGNFLLWHNVPFNVCKYCDNLTK